MSSVIFRCFLGHCEIAGDRIFSCCLEHVLSGGLCLHGCNSLHSFSLTVTFWGFGFNHFISIWNEFSWPFRKRFHSGALSDSTELPLLLSYCWKVQWVCFLRFLTLFLSLTLYLDFFFLFLLNYPNPVRFWIHSQQFPFSGDLRRKPREVTLLETRGLHWSSSFSPSGGLEGTWHSAATVMSRTTASR